jgi:two-component system alkaline phosphatase synthesis response regulator PhoP
MVKKIMIVDDEENIVDLIKAIFEQEGFEVGSASTGKECLEELKKVKPDLILMDIMMPGMTGKEAIKKIRENPKTKDIKIVFLTVARLSEVGKEELKNLRVLDYITKPFDNADLVRRVKKLVGE